MAREGKCWTQDTQGGGAKLGPDQTQSSWMLRIETKSQQRTLAWSPHFLQLTLGMTERRELRERGENGGKGRTEQARKEKSKKLDMSPRCKGLGGPWREPEPVVRGPGQGREKGAN